ncbi:MAG: 1-acyl-sn-glycerol-3-phosphate acyltransferase [Desulfobacterales bacterium]|nr:1-acyl-sn-glycerol-3-phosphate acyltransferase [Desulfobacterales bacterium]
MERNDRIYLITKTLSRMFLLPFFRLHTTGLENLPQKSAFILLPKHQRWEDIPLLGMATPNLLYYIAKHELFKGPLISRFLKSVGGIPLNRQRPLESRRSIGRLIELLKKGEGIVIFPEGTYYKNKIGPGHVGMIRLILSRFSLPFVPVGIKYSQEGFRTTVRVNFGTACFADSDKHASIFQDHIMKEVARLSGLTTS